MQTNKSIAKKGVFIEDFLDKFKYIPHFDIHEGYKASFNINLRSKPQKLTPILKLGTLDDANVISHIYKTVYDGCYPFKNLEDTEHLKKLMISNHYKWILFKTESMEIAGCLGFKINLDIKHGYLFGFAIKREFQKNIDSLKAWVFSLLYIWRKHVRSIPVWTSEVRTYCNTPQFANLFVNLIPVGFMPNKDIFNGKRESEFLTIAISNKLIMNRPSSKVPKLIRQILKPYSYSQKKFNLKRFLVENPNLNLKKDSITEKRNTIIIRTQTDKYYNNYVQFINSETKSYFKFFYSSINDNIERMEYKVNSIEELAVFLDKLLYFIKNNDVKYAECYVSAYKPEHQKLFHLNRFRARGYVPYYKYNKSEKIFEDSVLFNYYDGEVNENIKSNLINDTKQLYEKLMNQSTKLKTLP